MNPALSSRLRSPETLRWGACFALAVLFHAAGAAALVAKWNESSDLLANSPVIMMDLSPIAVAPDTTPTDIPPDQVLSRAQEPEAEPEKPVVKPELALIPPPPKPEKPKEQPKKKSLASAPAAADQKAERAAAPAPGANSRDPNAMPNWRSQLVSQIERNKRYPSEARGDRGVVQVAFGIDRSGGVHNAHVVGSSGSSLLDRDAIAWLHRAAPLPPPPPEMSGSMISITVPLRYNYR